MSQAEIRSFFKKRAASDAGAQENGISKLSTSAGDNETSLKKAKTHTEHAMVSKSLCIEVSVDGVNRESIAVASPKGCHDVSTIQEAVGQSRPTSKHINQGQIIEVKGDLFSCPKIVSLAHCVSEDLRLGKGIAKIFRDKFGGIDEMRRQSVKTGGVAVLRRPGGNAFVFSLVTKEKFWQKPTYDSLRMSLKSMREHMRANDVQEVAMPRIGCGLDGLQWNSVRKVIDEVFQVDQYASGPPIRVRIYSL